jgi:hypothetical protein
MPNLIGSMRREARSRARQALFLFAVAASFVAVAAAQAYNGNIYTSYAWWLDDGYSARDADYFGIDARSFWKQSRGEGAGIAIVDSGVTFAHEDIHRTAWTSPNEIAGGKIDDDHDGYVNQAGPTAEVFSGTLVVVHRDASRGRADSSVYQLNTDRGFFYALILSPGQQQALSALPPGRTAIALRGTLHAGRLTVSTIEQKQAAVAVDVGRDSAPPLGPQKIIVINTSDSSNAAVKGMFEGASDFYERYSYGKLSIVAMVVGPYHDVYPHPGNCSFDIGRAVAAADSEVDFGQFEYLAVIVPSSQCGWTGQGTVGDAIEVQTQEGEKPMAVMWINAYLLRASMVAHEFGHNLGSEHANAIRCGKSLIPHQADRCTEEEYGDFADVMGSSGSMTMNAVERSQSRWFNPGNVETVTRSGAFTLEKLAGASRKLKVLRIQRDSCADQAIWVENGADGVTVYLSDPRVPPLADQADQTGFCSPYWNLARHSIVGKDRLAAGTTISDPNTGTKIHVDRYRGRRATVTVTLGSRSDFTSPTLVISSPANNDVFYQPDPIPVVATISDDGSGIARVIYYETDIQHPLAVITSPPYDLTLDSSKFTHGRHWINIVAIDKAGQPWGGFGNSISDGRLIEVRASR